MGKLLAAIRLGDRTSHGGVVMEGFMDDTDDGVPLCGLGHIVSCPRHPGLQRIAEGEASFTIMGVPLALEGMLTTCGAVLIASSQSFIVEEQSRIGIASTPGFSQDNVSGSWQRQAVAGWPADDSLHDEQTRLSSPAVDGIPYYIETTDGRSFSGRADASGQLPRVFTAEAEDYRVYWGDEALARMESEASE